MRGQLVTEVRVDGYPDTPLWVKMSGESLVRVYPDRLMPVYRKTVDGEGFIRYVHVAHVPNGTIHAIPKAEAISTNGKKEERRGFPVVRFIRGDRERKCIITSSISFFEGLEEQAHVRVKGAVTNSKGEITHYEDAGVFPKSDLEVVGVEERP